MEIINGDAIPENGSRACSSDIISPPHTCYDGGSGDNPGCLALCLEHGFCTRYDG